VSADTSAIWLATAAMGLGTFALRASFLLLPERIRLSGTFAQALRLVPAAVLTAIWAPELLLREGVPALALDNERLLAGAAAIAVAWRFRDTLITIVAGLAALHLFDRIL